MEFIDLKAQYQANRARIDPRIHAVLDHGQFTMGPEVVQLEARLAEYVGVPHCITVSSSRDALLIALKALGIGRGDEVIATPLSSGTSLEAIVLAGATPVCADIDPLTCNLDATLIEERIGSRTRAILPVSLYGQAADMEGINAVASRHGLAVIEDAAQSFGATYQGKRSGNLGTVGCTSFFPTMPLGCYGNGGAIFTSDAELATAMRDLRRTCMHGPGQRQVHAPPGVGGPMDTLQCAVVLAKLERFDWELAQRRRVAAAYDALLSGKLDLVARRRDRTSTLADYVVMLDDRQRIQAILHAAGIPSAVHYPLPIRLQAPCARWNQANKGEEREDEVVEATPVARAMARRVLSLPIGPYMSDGEVFMVAATLLQALGQPLPLGVRAGQQIASLP